VQLAGGADRILSAIVNEDLSGHGPCSVPEKLKILSQERENGDISHRGAMPELLQAVATQIFCYASARRQQ
jgi:hypothetical protein